MHHGLVLDFLLYRGNDTSSKLLEALPKIKSVIFSRDRVSLAPKCTVLLLVSHKYQDYRYVPSDPAYTVRFQI